MEITNSCNFSCSFCYPSERTPRFLAPGKFRAIAREIRPFTSYVYLHVLGEPLLHPAFGEILGIAAEENLRVNITTNGTWLQKREGDLLRFPPRQMNISLHDIEENIPPDRWGDYLDEALRFASLISENTYVNFRLWNVDVAAADGFIRFCLDKVSTYFEMPQPLTITSLKGKGVKLAPHIFIEGDKRFDWPDGKTNRNHQLKKCYALRHQVAILSDGTVVPCCLDGDGRMSLGNIFEQSFSEIISSPRATAIKKGFEHGHIVEPFCNSCGFYVE